MGIRPLECGGGACGVAPQGLHASLPLAGSGRYRLGNFKKGMQRFVDSLGVWKNGCDIGVKHHNV